MRKRTRKTAKQATTLPATPMTLVDDDELGTAPTRLRPPPMSVEDEQEPVTQRRGPLAPIASAIGKGKVAVNKRRAKKRVKSSAARVGKARR
jgi:hypothetical protein